MPSVERVGRRTDSWKEERDRETSRWVGPLGGEERGLPEEKGEKRETDHAPLLEEERDGAPQKKSHG